jgi:hypothetical protein
MQVQPLMPPLLTNLPGSFCTANHLDGEASFVAARVDDAITITLTITFTDDHVPVAVSLSGVNHFSALSNQVKIDSKWI